MVTTSWKLNVVSYNTVIKACAQPDGSVGSKLYLDWMGTTGLNPDVVNYNASINAYAQQGKSADATRSFVHW